MSVPAALGFIACAIWVYLIWFRGGFWRLRERLAPQPSQSNVTVAAIVPARDEADNIALLVNSLRDQKFDGSLTITVADDESTDSTAEVARMAGADRVISVPPRPAEWKGKLWAVASGIRALSDAPDYLLLTDADIEYVSPEALASLIGKSEEGFDLVSIMVRLEASTRAEQLLIPAFVFFFFQLYPPAWVNSSGKMAAAAGGVMLIRPAILEKAGGIESIRTALIDDCALARRIKDAGGRTWLGISEPEIRSIRGYSGIGGIRAMIARSAFAQLRHSFWVLIATLLGLTVTYVLPVTLWFSRDPVVALAGATTFLAMAFCFRPTVRLYHAPFWIAFCLPLIAVFYGMATLESAFHYWTGRGGLWKGRAQDSPRPTFR